MVASSYVEVVYGVAPPVIEMIQLIVIGRNHVKLIWWLCFRLLQQGAFWQYFFRAVDFLKFKNITLYNFGHSDVVKLNYVHKMSWLRYDLSMQSYF